MKIIALNKKARHNYHLFQTTEAGIVLKGSEIKSLREHNIDLRDSFAAFHNQELFIINMTIPTYSATSSFALDPQRSRKLLLHRQELKRLALKIKTEKMLIIPTKIYFRHNVVKLELALAKPKKLYDKRQAAKERETKIRISKTVHR